MNRRQFMAAVPALSLIPSITPPNGANFHLDVLLTGDISDEAAVKEIMRTGVDWTQDDGTVLSLPVVRVDVVDTDKAVYTSQ